MLAAAWLCAARPADAQERPSERERKASRDESAARGERPDKAGRDKGCQPHSRPFRAGHRMGRGRHFFHLGPRDHGPLRPGEEEELLAFAQERLPHIHKALEGLRRRNPGRFRARLEEHAPRLRHLRRVYQRNPEIGGIMQKLAENEFRIRRGLHTLRREPPDSALFDAARQKTRELVADNVRLEIDVLTAYVGMLENERAERIENRVVDLIGAEADLAVASPRVREFVDAYHAAVGEAEREGARERIRQGVNRQLDAEIEALHQRIERMREKVPEEVDRRLERHLEAAQRRDGERRGRPRGPGRGP